jgi:protein TonB
MRAVFFLALCCCLWGNAVAVEDGRSSATKKQAEIDKLEGEQIEVLKRLKKEVQSLPDGAKRDQLGRLIAEIERRIQAERKVYVSPASSMTDEMRAYHARMVRRLEDCGTRHFPKRNGKSIYGKGVVTITLDQSGNVLATEVVESTGDKLLDSHLTRVVGATSPFGNLPSRATVGGSESIEKLVVVNSFNFESDASKSQPIDEKDVCKWR